VLGLQQDSSEMNKKAAMSGFESIMWVPKGILVAAALLILTIVFGMFVIDTVDVKSIHSMVFANHLLYDKNGVAYFDEGIKRVYPGIIDLDKFSTAVVETNIVMATSTLLAAKATLNSKESLYYKERQYGQWFPRRSIAGQGGSQEFLISKNVADSLFNSGTALFSILTPNTAK